MWQCVPTQLRVERSLKYIHTKTVRIQTPCWWHFDSCINMSLLWFIYIYIVYIYILDRTNSTLRGVSLPTFDGPPVQTPTAPTLQDPDAYFREMDEDLRHYFFNGEVGQGRTLVCGGIHVTMIWNSCFFSPRCLGTLRIRDTRTSGGIWSWCSKGNEQGCFGWRSNVPEVLKVSPHFVHTVLFFLLYGLPKTSVIQKFLKSS